MIFKVTNYLSDFIYVTSSNVYGSTAAALRGLRAFQGGRLKETLRGTRHMLPPTRHDAMCHSPAEDRPCFAAGNTRQENNCPVEVYLGLTINNYLYYY